MPRKKTLNDAPDLAGGVLKHKPATNGQAIDSTPDTLDSPTPPAAASLSATSNNDHSLSSEAVAASAPDHDPMPDAFIGHRPLIRATLPKTENDVPPPRAIPEFTMHQRPAGRGFGGGGRGGFRPHSFGGGHGFSSNGGAPQRDGNGPDGNRAPGPGGPGGPAAGPGGKSRHRRRHRRPR